MAVLLLIVMLSACTQNKSDNEVHNQNIPQVKYNADNEFMQTAIEEARTGIYNNCGGPFGSVVVKDGKVIGKGHNKVLADNDSTAHGEMVAIRCAEKNLCTHDLSGCEIYTTGQPCPMCLSACMWANIKKINYGCTIEDNDKIGFRDQIFDKALNATDSINNIIEMKPCDRDACLKLFDEYNSLDRNKY